MLLANYTANPAGPAALPDYGVVWDEDGVPIPGATVEAVSDDEHEADASDIDDSVDVVDGPVIDGDGVPHFFVVAEIIEDID